MILKVYDRDKKPLCTYYEGVELPSLIIIDSMQRAGYIFEVDGKTISAKKLKEMLK